MTHILKSLTVTLQKGVVHADGELVITEDSFHFTPYNQSFAPGPYKFPKADIASVEGTTARGGGLIPLSQEAVRITLKDGQCFEFILADPNKLIEVLTH